MKKWQITLTVVLSSLVLLFGVGFVFCELVY